MQKEKKHSFFDIIRDYLFTIILCIIITCLFRTFILQSVTVHGQSMYPTFIGAEENSDQKGDFLLVSKFPYLLNEPERFDIVVISSEILQKKIIKRIIGLPGEMILIKNGQVYINGELLEESYCLENILDPGIAETEILIKENEYFILGDNCNNSLDSRSELIGCINKKYILGKVIKKIE